MSLHVQEWSASLKFTYNVVTVDRSSPLGTGSYGAVYKAKCDELHCAAKVIHEALLLSSNYQGQGEGRILDNFYRECHFLSELKHPNIVQYLGTQHEQYLERTNVVLLMELMDESLTRCLERSATSLPLHMEIDICYDIALAISYLHSNYVVHRDLTSNNVLLDAGKRAKVTDFGVSKFIDPDTLHRSSMSLCPGTAVYMPPEALAEVQSPHYTEKLDCFSYGVLCIQIFTREFPKPSSRYRSIDAEEAIQNIMAVVSERTRRENHISMVQHGHIFLSTVLECLSDDEGERPSSQELCHRLTLIKENPVYNESREISTSQSDVQDDDIHERDRDTIRHLERELDTSRRCCDRLQEEKNSLSRSHRREITQKNNELQEQRLRTASVERQCHLKVQECEQKDLELSEMKNVHVDLQSEIGLLEESLKLKEIEIERLQQELSQKCVLLKQLQGKEDSLTRIKLQWREGNEACTKLRREPDAVLDNNVIYFKYFWGKNIYSYNTVHQSWEDIPGCPVSSFSMAVLDNLLTIIGGKSIDLAPVSTLYSYSYSAKNWMQEFPSMQVERYWTISNVYESFLVVIGGEGKDRRVLKTVEVLDLGTRQWSFASSLPRPMDSAASTICGDHLYVGGGSHPDTARYVTVCSLTHLLEDLHEEQRSISASLSQQRIWNQVDDLPYLKTSLTSVDGYLFAVGGKDEVDQPTSAIYVLDTVGKKWEKVSEMTYPRSSCYAIALPNNEIMVVGGINEARDTGKIVEIASLVDAKAT